jgi:uncharacterized protein YcbK (DUF882 family)
MLRALSASIAVLLAWNSARAQDGGVAPQPAPAAPAVAAQPDKPKTATKKKKRKPPPPPPPPVEMYALNTKETFMLKPDRKGRITKVSMKGFAHFLRCHHTGRQHAISQRLAQLIYDVDKHFEFKKILVVAGYRAPRVAREKGNPKSPHKKGVACDFRIEGIPNTELRDYGRTLAQVGVGYYPNSDFVHLDVDPLRKKRSAFWIDYSGPGERARYSHSPQEDLVAEKVPIFDGDEDADQSAAAKTQTPGGGGPHLLGNPGAPTPTASPALAPTTQAH